MSQIKYTADGSIIFEPSGKIISRKPIQINVSSNIAPLVVSSNTVVQNFNADMLDGQHAVEFVNTDNSGANTYVAFWTADNRVGGDANFIYDGDGRLILGGTEIFDNYPSIGLKAGFQLIANSSAEAPNSNFPQILVDDSTAASSHVFIKARGTYSDLQTPEAGDNLGDIVWRVWNGTDFYNMGYIRGYAEATPNTTNIPVALRFHTGNTTSSSERLRIKSDGDVNIVNNLRVGGAVDDTPVYNLEVVGDISVTQGLHANGSFGSTGEVLTANSTGGVYWADLNAAAGYVNVSGTPVDNQIAVFTDPNTIEGDANLTWDGTKFAIGTTNPDNKLHVAGSISLDAYLSGTPGKGIFFRDGFNESTSPFNLAILTHDFNGEASGNTSPDALMLTGFDGVAIHTGSNTYDAANIRILAQQDGDVNILGNTKIGGSAGDTPLAPLEVYNPTLGTTAGDVKELLTLRTTSGNQQRLEFFALRDANGTGWETAGTRIQSRIDSTYQSWIEFNGTAGDHSIAFGAGSDGGATDPQAVSERMRIKSDGNINILNDVKIGGSAGDTPAERLEVAGGNIEVQDTYGVIYRRNSDQYMVIDNNGQISTSPAIGSYTATNNAKYIQYNSTTDTYSGATLHTAGTLGHQFKIRGVTYFQISQDTTPTTLITASTDIVPGTDSTYDLGSDSLKWSQIHGDFVNLVNYPSAGSMLNIGTHVNNTNDAEINFYKARGGTSTPTQITAGDDLAAIRFYGHDSSQFVEAAHIIVDSTINTGNLGALLRLATGGTIEFNTGALATNAVTIDGSQNTTFKGEVLPGTDSTYDLGSTSLRWAEIHGDNISNKYDLPNSGASAGWWKLGTFTAGQTGQIIHIRVVSHDGYNANLGASQNFELDIYFKTSNGASLDGNGFAGDGQWYAIRGNDTYIQGSSNWSGSPVKFVANAGGTSATSFDVRIYFPEFTNSSFYEVTTSSASTWTHSLASSSDPGAGSSTVCHLTQEYKVLQDILPQANNTLDLGSTSLHWNTVYANTVITGSTRLKTPYAGSATSSAGITGISRGSLYRIGSAGSNWTTGHDPQSMFDAATGKLTPPTNCKLIHVTFNVVTATITSQAADGCQLRITRYNSSNVVQENIKHRTQNDNDNIYETTISAIIKWSETSGDYLGFRIQVAGSGTFDLDTFDIGWNIIQFSS